MTSQDSHAFTFQRIPDVASPIVIPTEKNATRDGERDRGNTTENIIMCKGVQFPVGTNIEETAGSIIRTSSESITVREKPTEDRLVMLVKPDSAAVHTRRR